MSAILAPKPAPAPEERRGNGHFELIAELLEEFARGGELRASLAFALRRIVEAADAEGGAIFQLQGAYDSPDATLICRASVGESDITGISLPANKGVAGRAVLQNRTQVVADALHDPDFIAPAKWDIQYQVRSIITAPLSFRDQRFGVVDIVNPRKPGALFTAADAELLTTLAAAASIAIHNTRLTTELMAQEKLRQELELAAAVQRTLLPPEQPESAPLHGLNLPARGVSGDFYDILPLEDGRIVFAIADVSGKGMNAALVMAKVATLFRSFGKLIHQPGKLLGHIESELSETLSFGMFVTMAVGVYDPRRHSLRLANAGHPPALLRHCSGKVEWLRAEDPPLGVTPRNGEGYRERDVPIAGGSLYLYSDGVTEARDASGEMQGDTGLLRLIETHIKAKPGARLQAIAQDVRTASPGGATAELRDDLTLLVLEDSAPGDCARAQTRKRGEGLLVSQVIPAQAAELKVVRRLVAAAASQVGASREWGEELALAVDEACQNIIRHGYSGACGGRIELAIRSLRGSVVVELVDQGKPVKSEDCRGRRLDEVRPGGLGTHFMRALTDGVRYTRPRSGGNRLVLTKKLKAGAKEWTAEHP
jgi:phosphoserine phosphatase RsbU/P